MWITKDDYDQSGPSIVHRKCCGGFGKYHSTRSDSQMSNFVPPPRVKTATAEETDLHSEMKPLQCDVVAPPIAEPKQSNVIESRQLADPNSVLLRCGSLVARGKEGIRGKPVQCSNCGAIPSPALVGTEENRVPLENIADDGFEIVALQDQEVNSESSLCIPCEFCGLSCIEASACEHISITDSPDATEYERTYFLSPAREACNSDDITIDLDVPPPMVIFCVDISASMSTSLKLEGGTTVTRLQCVQTAVSQQLAALRRNQPTCIAVIVTFGAEVCVYTDGGNRSLVARRAHDDVEALVAKGHDISLECSEKVGEVGERLGTTVASLKVSGNTALGPALAVATGLARGRAGSRIVLCTDGMANNGVGAIKNRDQIVEFYGDMGRRAGEEGTCISVITMEGEDCSMENLGICADLTGGQVEMVDLQALASKVGAILQHATLATGMKLALISGAGITLNGHLDSEQKGSACRAVFTLGTVTARTDLTLQLQAAADLLSKNDPSVPLQVQLQYTRPDGEEVLQVLTKKVRLCGDRNTAEAEINGTCIGLSGIHIAARLAQQGEYRSARIHLISTCRLLQRAMNNLAHQESYLSFVVQAEKLDGFMRERECQDKIFGTSGNSRQGRDDDASRSMYQMKSLSACEFTSKS
jgi:hypothetical protein